MLRDDKMTTSIEGIYKNGVIKPIRSIKLKENTKVVITVKDQKEDNKSIMKFSGSWRNYKTFDGRTLDDVKEEIYSDRKLSTRKEIKFQKNVLFGY